LVKPDVGILKWIPIRTRADIYERVYEYFLTQFADLKAHDGGEFFTPSSIVQLIVNAIEPDHGNRRARHPDKCAPGFHRFVSNGAEKRNRGSFARYPKCFNPTRAGSGDHAPDEYRPLVGNGVRIDS